MSLAVRGAYIDSGTLFRALLSGLLFFLSFPKFGTGLLAWIAFVPLLCALQQKRPSQGFLIGFITGFSGYIGIIYWIVHVVVNYGYLPVPVGIAVMLLLAAYLALYIGLFAAGVVYFQERGVSPILAAPLLWTCLEYAKSHLLTGFPWENLGYSQYLYTYLVQSADITGVFGLSFAIVLINVIISRIFIFRRPGVNWKGRGRRVAAEVAAGALIVVILIGYGMFRIGDVENSRDRSPKMPVSLILAVSLIQGNIDQNIKWNPAFQEETVRIYQTLTRQAAPSAGGLVVWPETATPFFFQDQHELHREVASLPRFTGDWMLRQPQLRQGRHGDGLSQQRLSA